MEFLTFEKFKQHLNNIKKFNQRERDFFNSLSKCFGEVETPEYARDAADQYLNLLIEIMHDDTDSIAEFIYESEFGKVPVKVLDLKTEKTIQIRTVRQLYSYLKNRFIYLNR